MIRNIFIFLGTFVAGAALALVVRAARFAPHADHAAPPAPAASYAPMVSNPLTPANAVPAPAAPANAHDHTISPAAAKSSPADTPVNTVCAICGMDVDAKVPTLEYKGKKIGFGCRMCPPKFKAEPDRYGPYYLRNEIAPK